MKRFYILCDDNSFPQRKYAWENIHIEKIKNIIEEHGFDVNIASFCEIANGEKVIHNSFIYYASSQIKERKEYIEDVLIGLMLDSSNILLPKFEIFRAHENKGFQEIYKRHIGIDSLKGFYSIGLKGIKAIESYPQVLKTVDGYGSSGVWCANNMLEASEIYIKNIKKKNVRLNIKNILKEYILKKKYSQEHIEYKKNLLHTRFVTQNFIPNLSFDYKILVFGKKFYVLKRFIKKNDFRASGSGLWEFQENNDMDMRILDFARNCYSRLDLPFVSLDICSNDQECYLIEFQGLHMGSVTLMHSKGYFELSESKWNFVRKKSDFEEEIANSLLFYFKDKNT